MALSVMTSERYQVELDVLNSKLSPNLFRFRDVDGPAPNLVIAVRTNRGNVYTLYFDLQGFPDSGPPKVFVTRMLRTRSGEEMSGCSAPMCTLPSEHGWTRIRHYDGASWTSTVSLYKIYVISRLWLVMYELHLQNGRPLAHYLNHED